MVIPGVEPGGAEASALADFVTYSHLSHFIDAPKLCVAAAQGRLPIRAIAVSVWSSGLAGPVRDGFWNFSAHCARAAFETSEFQFCFHDVPIVPREHGDVTGNYGESLSKQLGDEGQTSHCFQTSR